MNLPTCPFCDHDQVVDGRCLECGREVPESMTASESTNYSGTAGLGRALAEMAKGHYAGIQGGYPAIVVNFKAALDAIVRIAKGRIRLEDEGLKQVEYAVQDVLKRFQLKGNKDIEKLSMEYLQYATKTHESLMDNQTANESADKYTQGEDGKHYPKDMSPSLQKLLSSLAKSGEKVRVRGKGDDKSYVVQISHTTGDIKAVITSGRGQANDVILDNDVWIADQKGKTTYYGTKPANESTSAYESKGLEWPYLEGSDKNQEIGKILGCDPEDVTIMHDGDKQVKNWSKAVKDLLEAATGTPKKVKVGSDDAELVHTESASFVLVPGKKTIYVEDKTTQQIEWAFESAQAPRVQEQELPVQESILTVPGGALPTFESFLATQNEGKLPPHLVKHQFKKKTDEGEVPDEFKEWIIKPGEQTPSKVEEGSADQQALKDWWKKNALTTEGDSGNWFVTNVLGGTGLNEKMLDHWAQHKTNELKADVLAKLEAAKAEFEKKNPTYEGKLPDHLKKHQFKANEGKMPDHVLSHFKKKRGVKEDEELSADEQALLEAAYQAIGEAVLEAQTIAEGEIPAALKKHQFKKEKAGKAKESIKEAIASGVLEGLNFGGPSDATIREYPSIEDHMEGTDDRIKTALAAGPPTEVKIIDWFEDDHEDCALVVMKIGTVEVKVSFWWLSRSGSKLLGNAEDGKASALKTVYTSLIKPIVEEFGG